MVPRPLRAAARVLPGRAARTLAARDPVERLLAMSGKLDDRLRPDLLRGALVGTEGSAGRAVGALARGLPNDPLTSTLFLDAQLALVDDMLHYFDRASMAHSLEVRVPFLDHELVEWSAHLPLRLKVRGAQTKVLLKRVARGLVPDEVVDKRKIGFFNGAAGGWLQSQVAGAVSDYLLDPSPRYAELLERREVERLVAGHRDGSGDTGLLLAVLMLEVWLSSFLPRAARAAAPVEAVA
jgi:asparagine synthase (glutamine-hydrolysing)